MVGYGPEDTHFVVELTYNYGITHYETGNDFIGLTVSPAKASKEQLLTTGLSKNKTESNMWRHLVDTSSSLLINRNL